MTPRSFPGVSKQVSLGEEFIRISSNQMTSRIAIDLNVAIGDFKTFLKCSGATLRPKGMTTSTNLRNEKPDKAEMFC